jgi:hypothetical protein
LSYAPSFVGRKEKRSVPLDRAAERAAKLILIELGIDGVEVSLCVEDLVAKVFVDVAMKRIGA